MNLRKRSPLLSGTQTVTSIRDTGYKSTDYALAELIDNGVQENAETVLVVFITEEVKGRKRLTRRVVEINVIDDGDGMTEEVAAVSLAFGGSNRYNDRKGMGRFGMGLPAASVSQSKRVDVWTWQDTQPLNALHTYLDLVEIEQATPGELMVPYPTYPGEADHLDLPHWIPDLVQAHNMRSRIVGGVEVRSGTVVQWRNLDRLRWVRAEAIRFHTENLLGRIYRRFLTGEAAPKRTIKLGIVDKDELTRVGVDTIEFYNVRPNDPLYLLRPDVSTLEYWERRGPDGNPETVADVPVFETFPAGRDHAQTFPVNYEEDGQAHTGVVEVRATMARRDARPGRNPGAGTHQGRHARHNAGVSVVRADRELLLEQTLATEATDRWWGIEVAFDPELDEVFGVTNNKQDVPYFTQALKLVQQEPTLTRDKALEEGLFDEDHPLADLYEIAQRVSELSRQMKSAGKREQQAVKSNTGQGQPGVTAGISQAKSRGALPPAPGVARFKAENPTPESQEQATRAELQKKHPTFTEPEIDAIMELRQRQFSVQIITESHADNDAFFWPETSGDLEILCLNNANPAYDHLLEPLRLSNEQIKNLPEKELRGRLARGADALAMLLLMWLQMEIGNQGDAATYDKIREVRQRWGQAVRSGLGVVLSPEELLAASGLLDDEDDENDEEGEEEDGPW
jgi:hypothetical protein